MEQYLEAERRPGLALLPGIVDQPKDTLGQVMAHPRWRWLVPALACMIALIIFLAVAAPYLSEQAQQQQALALQRFGDQLSGMTEAQRQEMQDQMTRFTGPVFLAGTAFATRLIGLFLSWAIGAGFLYFGLQMAGRELDFGQLFAGFSWTWLPFCLRDLLNAGWVFATRKLILNPGLSYFVATGDQLADAQNPLWVLAGNLDLFLLWHFALVFFLVRATRRRGGGLGLALVYVVLALALRVLPPLLLSQFSFGG